MDKNDTKDNKDHKYGTRSKSKNMKTDSSQKKRSSSDDGSATDDAPEMNHKEFQELLYTSFHQSISK